MIKPSIDSIEELLVAGLMDRSEAQRSEADPENRARG